MSRPTRWYPVVAGTLALAFAACGDAGSSSGADTDDAPDTAGDVVAADTQLAADTQRVDTAAADTGDDTTAAPGPPTLVAPQPVTPGGEELAVQPALAVGAEGRVLVAWTGRRDDKLGIHRAVLAAAGDVVANAAQVNTDARGIQNEPSACALAGGGYVIAWSVDTQEAGPDGENLEVRYRRYDADGLALDATGMRVYTGRPGNHWLADVACAPGGGFVVAGVRPGDGPGFSVFFQRYGAGGVADGDAVTALASTTGGQAFPAVAVGPGDAVIVAWEDTGTTDADTRLVWRRFPTDGPPSEVNALAAASGVDAAGASAAAGPGGALALSGNLGTKLQLRWLSAHDGAVDTVTVPAAANAITSQGVLAPVGDGRFAALWFQGSGSSVAARVGYFGEAGFSGDITLSTGSFPLAYRPALACAGGVLAAAWTESLGGGAYAVRVALITASE